ESYLRNLDRVYRIRCVQCTFHGTTDYSDLHVVSAFVLTVERASLWIIESNGFDLDKGGSVTLRERSLCRMPLTI
ncbi:unnamed protein product, partial [Allacma fusca]